jgi:hypothetical protein
VVVVVVVMSVAVAIVSVSVVILSVVAVIAVVSSKKPDDSVHVEPAQIYESRGITYSETQRCRRVVTKCRENIGRLHCFSNIKIKNDYFKRSR